ncbi:hypothetical protein CEXT_400031 [Caerostris extrusa]|uniref:Uncharacterized protein n=1 Tax=Caerostris extrusa TaxID=172846 RepID=A0AAV4PHA7_CAEEX|nr:hypothetical protein CEXT_400031 [Caerostris extrusa]
MNHTKYCCSDSATRLSSTSADQPFLCTDLTGAFLTLLTGLLLSLLIGLIQLIYAGGLVRRPVVTNIPELLILMGVVKRSCLANILPATPCQAATELMLLPVKIYVGFSLRAVNFLSDAMPIL